MADALAEARNRLTGAALIGVGWGWRSRAGRERA
jgi:hypothetical protein